MRRRIVATVVVVGLIVAGISPLVTAQSTTQAPASDDITPGQRLSAAIGAQEAAIRGSVDERVLLRRLAGVQSNSAQADILNQTIDAIEERIEAIQAEQTTLEQRFEAGELSYGEYVARTAQLLSRERSLQRLLGTTADRAATLPADIRERTGIDRAALSRLRERARNATGSAVAETARDLAGPPFQPGNRSNGTGRGPPSDVGPPTGETGDIAEVARTIRHAEQRVAVVSRLAEAGEAADTLAAARTALADAQDALEAARSASAAGEEAQVDDHLDEAADLAEQALDLAEEAREQATGGPPETDDDDDEASDRVGIPVDPQ